MSYFDHFADSPGTKVGNWITDATMRMQFKFICQYLPQKTGALLEIGPGMGVLANLFSINGYDNYTAVEPNPRMRNRLISLGFHVKDYIIPELKEEDNSFDILILLDVFEHLNNSQEASDFLTEAWRVLRPGGKIVIASPDYLHWREDFFNCDFSHSNITTVRRLIQLFHNHKIRTLNYYYMSAFLSGRKASISSTLFRSILFFANSNGIDQKPYKLKLTFLRRFLIIGEKLSGV